MEDNAVSMIVYIDRQFYPKPPKEIEDGDWAIVSAHVDKIGIDGQMHDYETFDFNHVEETLDVHGNLVRSKPYEKYKLKTHPYFKTVSLKGKMCKLENGTPYKVTAIEEYDEKYKSWAYNIQRIHEQFTFTDERQVKTFLIRAVGTERQVENIFETFKDYKKIIEILENQDIESLQEVHGIGHKTAETIIQKYILNEGYSKAFVELEQYKLSNTMILKLINKYGSPDIVVSKVKKNPYILADEVDGVGFKKADDIAMSAGFDRHSPYRASAYIQYYFAEQIQEGNSFVDNEDLIESLYDTLGNDFPIESISSALRHLADEEVMWSSPDQNSLGLMKYYNIERLVALNLLRLIYAENNFHFEDWEERIKEVEKEQGWEHTEEQMIAIESTLNHNVVLTAGGAGCGKTSTVSAMLSCLSSDYLVGACALSGKASVNISDATGGKIQGETIHRLLGYNPSRGFGYDSENPLPHDVIILDEISMVDAELFARLLMAIKDGAKLIMLGDTGQLKNIGCGNIAFDIINSGLIPCNLLTKTHRQAQKSAIVTVSKDVRNGTHIVEAGYEGRMTLGELQDLDIVAYKEHEDREVGADGKGVGLIMEEYLRLRKDCPNIMDIIVLLPTNTRGTSTYKLNLMIQKHEIRHKRGLNATPIEIGGNYPYKLHVGDKVINTKNNYESYYKEFIGEDEDGKPIYNKIKREIFNGNMGVVTRINHKEQEIEVDFENIGLVTILKDNLSDIQLGYAISVHRSQGSGVKYVITGLDFTHYKMLCRELLYTALTRAKKHCVLVGDTRAIRKATSTTNAKDRQTFLPYFLGGSLPLLMESSKNAEISE